MVSCVAIDIRQNMGWNFQTKPCWNHVHSGWYWGKFALSEWFHGSYNRDLSIRTFAEFTCCSVRNRSVDWKRQRRIGYGHSMWRMLHTESRGKFPPKKYLENGIELRTNGSLNESMEAALMKWLMYLKDGLSLWKEVFPNPRSDHSDQLGYR